MEKGILTSAERDFYLQRPTRQTETSAEARSMLPAPAGMLEVTKPGKWPKISLRTPRMVFLPATQRSLSVQKGIRLTHHASTRSIPGDGSVVSSNVMRELNQ